MWQYPCRRGIPRQESQVHLARSLRSTLALYGRIASKQVQVHLARSLRSTSSARVLFPTHKKWDVAARRHMFIGY